MEAQTRFAAQWNLPHSVDTQSNQLCIFPSFMGKAGIVFPQRYQKSWKDVVSNQTVTQYSCAFFTLFTKQFFLDRHIHFFFIYIRKWPDLLSYAVIKSLMFFTPGYRGNMFWKMENCIYIYIVKKTISDLHMQTCSHLYSDQRILSVRRTVVYKIKKPASIEMKRSYLMLFSNRPVFNLICFFQNITS